MRISRLIIFILLIFPLALCGQHDVPDLPEYYVDVEVKSIGEVRSLPITYSIDKISKNTANDLFQVRLWIPKRSFADFITLDIPYSIFLEDAKSVDITNSYLELITNWNRYPTYEAYLQTLSYFASNHTDICKIDTIMRATPQGRLIPVIHINNGDDSYKPSVLLSSTIHGDEICGYYLLLRLADLILSQRDEPKIQQIIDHVDLWICPLENPDGTYYSGNHIIGQSPISTRGNSNSVDLNRDFPTILGVSKNGYEPETEAFMRFFEQQNFVLSAVLHGGAELVNYPWDSYTTSQLTHPDKNWMHAVSRRFVESCRSVNSNYMRGFPSGVTSGGDWYVVYGSQQDYVTYYEESRDFTIEISNSKIFPANQLNSIWNTTRTALLDFILEAHEGVRGCVFDASTQQSLSATLFVENHDQAVQKSFVSTNDAGQYCRLITPGTYQITCTAEGFHPVTKSATVVAGEPTELDFDLSPLTTSQYERKICQIYPTLADQTITISMDDPMNLPATCEIYTINGNLQHACLLTHCKTEINISGFAQGAYLIRIQKNNLSELVKFVKL
ncbi:carboxypeptidase regulatory-like domain-containing protein [Bacteroidales bacterium OttesenSCG-928-B11]|nr:carboxypeptidase regulatory-like domain-containing protein [Bacteroidales bacterium OttesenSCG-928-E04]MDL2312292.1 carboxypeptidase regulatory-like domain-containing protein [Bacteroidales bacterium OttesenSCG-928-B11]MDL2326377.1 carboxypeptidase regulatory-like domain-containing protein [Bacteroidales bacterium OttesenSCG-928-A14]